MEKMNQAQEELKNVEREFLNVSDAIERAFNNILDQNKKAGNANNAAYVWRQRFQKGKLSHKKVSEILEEAGFKKVVEEKWILINKQSSKPQAASVKVREDRSYFQEIAPGRGV